MTESTVAEGANVFYVYLLLKTPMVEPPVLGTFDLDQVLYAGKGKGYRWHSHFQEALQGSEGEKADALRAALGDTPSPEEIERHAIIVAGHLSETEAFRLEAIMIHLVGGVSTVTNLVAGHGSSEIMVPAFDARVFFGAEALAVDAWSVSGTSGQPQAALLATNPPGEVVFVVKGTGTSLTEAHWRRSDRTGRFPRSLEMELTDQEPTVRRGWDPHHPWSPEEASARAQRFWSGSPASVTLWQQLIRTRGGSVALIVPDPRDGRSVVRYVWAIDPDGIWEDYGNRFGFPLAAPVNDHPWLGKRLVHRSTGRGFLRSPSAPGLTLCPPRGEQRGPADSGGFGSSPADARDDG